MDAYTEKEIDLAKRIYNATMLVSDRVTTRKARNLAKKLGAPPPDENPDEFSLQTARVLLKHYEEEIQKAIRNAVEAM